MHQSAPAASTFHDIMHRILGHGPWSGETDIDFDIWEGNPELPLRCLRFPSSLERCHSCDHEDLSVSLSFFLNGV